MTIRIALIGFGKIAADQHVPAIAADPRFELVAVASQRGAGAAHAARIFTDHREMLAAMPEIDAVAICTPPGPRTAIALDCLAAGKAVMLEKPPAATLSELARIEAAAAAPGAVAFATWHSRMAPAVAAARVALAGAEVTRLRIEWFEDVRCWHPGQDWVWQPGGFGVFDPGINALSIATALLPGQLAVRAATVEIPANRAMPIAAQLTLAGSDRTAAFDWRARADEHWTIEIATAAGRTVRLTEGGAKLAIDGREVPIPTDAPGEYPALYARFANLIAAGESDMDAAPFRLVADAFLLAERRTVEPFHW
ncbi:MAG: Gfo/Idh/MocA family oxidoreductase [Alphaproteobacteria bacterium]|nr:Gfo/Idh/MocA family oxidoreductase [Alphaproteobacteria bacterium]